MKRPSSNFNWLVQALGKTMVQQEHRGRLRGGPPESRRQIYFFFVVPLLPFASAHWFFFIVFLILPMHYVREMISFAIYYLK